MWKDALIIGAVAGLGEFGARKFGTQIEAKAIEMKIPTPVAHAAVVGGFAVGAYLLVKAVM